MFKGKKVLVTGGTGLIGRHVVELLLERGAKVRVASLDDSSRAHPGVEFKKINLMYFEHCMKVCDGMDCVFHIAGIKGSPQVTTSQPASFFVPTISFNTNMMEAARQCDVRWYLFTSTVGVYAPAEVFHEDDVWRTFPSRNDRFAGWAKRMGELQAEAYKIQHGWDRVSIVRPANVYGAFDNFEAPNAMVIPSLIKRVMDGEDPLIVWGDGSQIRDFIHAKDVARGILMVVEKKFTQPVNLGSGVGITIKKIVDVIVGNTKKKPRVIWDILKPVGDKKRLMDVSRARSLGFDAQIPIEQGIPEVMKWYEKNKAIAAKRYNVFTQANYI